MVTIHNFLTTLENAEESAAWSLCSHIAANIFDIDNKTSALDLLFAEMSATAVACSSAWWTGGRAGLRTAVRPRLRPYKHRLGLVAAAITRRRTLRGAARPAILGPPSRLGHRTVPACVSDEWRRGQGRLVDRGRAWRRRGFHFWRDRLACPPKVVAGRARDCLTGDGVPIPSAPNSPQPDVIVTINSRA
ncbi:MAG: hypothetical protein JWQ89_2293 [Devosia sp.]|nr:hypothetical protein [Devosia sp.]